MGISETYYRRYNFASSLMLTCLQKNDAFTVNDTNNGNVALTYGVGLATNDEVVLAGGWDLENSKYYLYSGQGYWTMSPSDFDGDDAYELFVFPHGSADDNRYVGSTRGVRPVLNLSSEILKNGTGTASDPYHA